CPLTKPAAALTVLRMAVAWAIVCNAVFLISERVDNLRSPSGVDETGLLRVQVTGIGREANPMAMTREDLAAIRGIPGVISATAVNQVPLGMSSWNTSVNLTPEQQEETVNATMYMGGPDLFDTLGLTLAAGTWLSPDAFETYDEEAGFRGITPS